MQPVEVVFDPHVQTAIICLVAALLVGLGLGAWMATEKR